MLKIKAHMNLFLIVEPLLLSPGGECWLLTYHLEYKHLGLAFIRHLPAILSCLSLLLFLWPWSTYSHGRQEKHNPLNLNSRFGGESLKVEIHCVWVISKVWISGLSLFLITTDNQEMPRLAYKTKKHVFVL